MGINFLQIIGIIAASGVVLSVIFSAEISEDSPPLSDSSTLIKWDTGSVSFDFTNPKPKAIKPTGKMPTKTYFQMIKPGKGLLKAPPISGTGADFICNDFTKGKIKINTTSIGEKSITLKNLKQIIINQLNTNKVTKGSEFVLVIPSKEFNGSDATTLTDLPSLPLNTDVIIYYKLDQ